MFGSFLKSAFLFIVSTANANPVDVTFLHTSDLHTHLISRDSPRRLGGFARLKGKIDQIRAQQPNTFLVDTGDWSEGSLFFTLKSGEVSHRLISHFGYDAMVLGNHEWLVGPNELESAFRRAEFKTPILTANLNIPPQQAGLKEFIQPYMVKNVNGVKIGIFGLTTYEFIFDPFFEPVNIQEPFFTARRMVKHLREKEKCDVVILLSHMGVTFDRLIAKTTKGIDAIFGGHTHLLFRHPEFVGKVPIFHIGAWGEYLGEYRFRVSSKGLQILGTKVHEITSDLPEDPMIRLMVEGYQQDMSTLFSGNIFNDQVAFSESELHLRGTVQDTPLGNWYLDWMRDVGKADLALDHMGFTSRNLYQGWISSYDIWNAFPHIFNPKTQKSWEVVTFETTGTILKVVANVMLKFASGLRISDAEIEFNPSNKISVVEKFLIRGQPIESGRKYRVACSEGVLYFLKKYLHRTDGSVRGISNLQSTGLEIWRMVRSRLGEMKTISQEKAQWVGRIRTRPADLYVPREQLSARVQGDGSVKVQVQIVNTGLKPSTRLAGSLWIDKTPENSLDDSWEILDIPAGMSDPINGGESRTLEFTSHLMGASTHFAFQFYVKPSGKEKFPKNNSVLFFTDLELPRVTEDIYSYQR